MGPCLVDRSVAVVVPAFGNADRNDIELAMPNAPFGNDRFSETPDRSGRAFQYHAFQTVIVIEVGVHRGDGQVVVVVLQLRQPFGQITLVVIENIG